MKTATPAISILSSIPGLLIIAACLWLAPAARAGLAVDVHLYHDNFGYYFYPYLSTNTTPPDYPLGDYVIASPQIPTNGSQLFYQATTNGIAFGINGNYGGGNYYGDFDSFIFGITNGQWSISVTNSTSTNLYFFSVKVTGLTSNIFGPAPQAVYPTSGQTLVPNQPLMQWTGPANWAGTLYVQDNFVDTNGNGSYVTGQYLSPDATSWTPGAALPDGTNQFSVDYQSNVTAMVTASQPTNASGQPISGWDSTATIEAHFAYGNDYNVSFTVGQPLAFGVGGHTNVTYYSFEDNSLFAHDFSGNGNDINSYGDYAMSPYITNDAVAGSYAFGAAGDGWLYPPTNLLATLAGSFSVSLWVKTSEVQGNDNDDVYSAAGIVSAFNGGQNAVMPMGINGSKLAFYTGGSSQDTLHSQTSVNTGQYVHVVVTRNRQTGEKKIYVNGVLDVSDFGSTDFLSDATELDIGYNNGQTFTGELDDIQFYSGVLSSNEVLQLYDNPGTTIPDVAGSGLNGPVAHYDFDEGTALAADVSGNNNNVVYAGNFGGSGPATSSDAVAGSGSVSFDGGSYLTASSNLLTTLASDFTVSLWLKTSQNFGSQNDLAWEGAGVIAADSPNGGAKDLIPVALTGGQVAFNVGDGVSDNTLNSSATINDDAWHHVVVTRNQSTGERQIFIDGLLDSSDFATTVLLNDPVLLTIGAKSDASNPDPASPDYNGSNGYEGLLDDVQVYNRVLTPEEVAFLYNHPGAVIAGSDFDTALNTANVTWTTGGDLPWFTETATALDGLAAQSGPIADSQSSHLDTTVPADGNVSFYWKVSSEQDFDFLTFYINGVEQDAISGEVDWNQETYSVSAGDVLRWEYSKDDSNSEGQDAGWLDQVVLPGNADTNPVSADINVVIYREQDPTFGDIFIAFPYINSTLPAATGTTTNTVESPTGKFHGEINAGGGGPSSTILFSFGDLMNEFTNGLWTLYIHKGMPNERQFHFSATINGLTTNLLSAVKIITPTNGATGVSTNTAFQWLGPTNYSSLNVSKQFYIDNSGYVGAALAVTATNWPSPPSLAIGTNRFDITYTSNNFPGITFTVPIDNASLSVSNWVASFDLLTTAASVFVVSPGASPAHLINVSQTGGNFQFSFISLSAFSHAVQYRTNLTAGSNWQTYTNVPGDGTLKTISLPLSLFSPARQGFIRVSTQ